MMANPIRALELHYPMIQFFSKSKVKVHTSEGPTRPELIFGFHGMKQAQEYCYLPLDGMLVHSRVTTQEYVAGTHLYTWVKRDKVE